MSDEKDLKASDDYSLEHEDNRSGGPKTGANSYTEKTNPNHVEHYGSSEPQAKFKVHNVLTSYTRAELLADVANFAEENGMTDYLSELQKGALVAQHPHAFESIPELTEDDRQLLRDEKNHKWKHPADLYWVIMLCSLGASVQGWDQTGINGANLSYPNEFGIANTTGSDPWLQGLINSAPYLGSVALGCWISDPLNKYLGRRGVIFVTALGLIATPIGSAFTQSWQALFVVRLVLGFFMGAKGSTVPIFAAELSPAAIRGALVMSWQFWTAFGIFIGYVANVICLHIGGDLDHWRYMLASAFIPAVPLAAGIFFCPESPRWLLKKGKVFQAFKSFRRMRWSDMQACRDVYYVAKQLEAEAQVLGGRTYLARLKELFTIPRVRRATLGAFVVMLAQQMCGINIIAFYSATVFELSNFTTQQALYASMGFGAINFLWAIPAFYTIDTYGRRTLLLFTFPFMALTLLLSGLCFLIPEDNKAHLALVALFIYIFAMFYSPGEGPVPFTYSAEVFPLAQREMGMGFAVATCLGFAFVLSLTFPAMVDAMTVTGAFGFYAGLNLIAFCLIFLFVPETKGRTLEELDQVFNVPTKEFISYQFNTYVPWWTQRYIFRNKNAKLAPLIEEEDDDLITETNQPKVMQQ